eukprot:1140651-Pelagomonas_calceolata.AAC.1
MTAWEQLSTTEAYPASSRSGGMTPPRLIFGILTPLRLLSWGPATKASHGALGLLLPIWPRGVFWVVSHKPLRPYSLQFSGPCICFGEFQWRPGLYAMAFFPS